MSKKGTPAIWISRLVFYAGMAVVLWSHSRFVVRWVAFLMVVMFLSDIALFIDSRYRRGGQESN